MKQLATSNGDYDLSSEQAVLSHELAAGPDAYRLAAEVRAGDGAKNLAGGGVYRLRATAGGVEIFRSDVLVASGVMRRIFDLEFLGRPSETVAILLTGLAADTDVDVTAYLYAGVDVTEISGDATAADNLEAVLDGTGGVVLKAAQLKLECDVPDEGALDCRNTNSAGSGQYNVGGDAGQYNAGSDVGQFNTGNTSGQLNIGTTAGQSNEGGTVGQYNNTTNGEALRLQSTTGKSLAIVGSADKLDNLDAAVSTRATSSDVTGAHATTDGKIDAVAAILSGITSLAKWLRGLFRSDAMDATAKAEVNAGGGTFDEATDSLEAIRDTEPLGTPMRGTDSAALASVCTEARLAHLDAAVSSRAAPDDVVTQVLPGTLQVTFPTFTLTGASTQPFDLAEGAAVDVALVFQDSGGNAVDLTDAHLRFRVFERGDDDEVFALDSETGGITITDAEAGQAVLEFSAEDLATPGRYRYEFWETGGPTLYAKGDFVVRATLGPGS